MTNKPQILLIFIKFYSYLLNYFSYFFLTYFACELVIVIMTVIIQTRLEKIFFLLLSSTPTLNLWGKSSFQVGKVEIVTFFFFWSFILMIIQTGLQKIIKFQIKRHLFFLFFTALHLLALYRLQATGSFFLIICFFYFSSILSYFIYRAINQIRRFVEGAFLKQSFTT
ncbi:hypothetical protein A3H86_02405 [Candidatus Roizmanbacteria bacterium RIFCSPLOWO2_02_FULL_41_9]|uniref:Uncharacterized protein n=1 Tax=Candidatus Roizmanbacteria bacterium RIFCSPLOWO2_02_FULL_41_9 TaxID=1802077 RepID=A0A1F7JS23_9BACT|nr:MAG: hypothetical protein A3H86_02405 [Candidatus Roizmanbacteria bacterium RIFCSPLOWO2_02_FULL_41_9]